MILTKKQKQSLDRFPHIPRDARFPEDAPVMIENGSNQYVIWANTYSAILQKTTDTPFLPTRDAHDILTMRCFAREKTGSVLKNVTSSMERTLAKSRDIGITDMKTAVATATGKGLLIRKGRYPKAECSIRIRDRTYNPGYISEFMKITEHDTFFFAMNRERRHLLLMPVTDKDADPGQFMRSKEFQDMPVLFLLETLCSKQDKDSVADADIITQ